MTYFRIKIFDKKNRKTTKIDTFEALNEKTTTERESLTSQLSESNQVRSELQLHITQLEQQYKEVILSDIVRLLSLRPKLWVGKIL